MDECPGDSPVSASPGGPPWPPHRPRFQLRVSNSLPSQPPFTLCCLFVHRAPGHQKRRFPEYPELEAISGSVLNIFGGEEMKGGIMHSLLQLLQNRNHMKDPQ
ncbi:hypothetical protein MC885_016819 [Smutsia gigantea]|nr:hypothetical protein MC885_016819 [Smutsia gigantea]